MTQLLFAIMIQGMLYTGAESFDSTYECERRAQEMREYGAGAVCVDML